MKYVWTPPAVGSNAPTNHARLVARGGSRLFIAACKYSRRCCRRRQYTTFSATRRSKAAAADLKGLPRSLRAKGRSGDDEVPFRTTCRRRRRLQRRRRRP